MKSCILKNSSNIRRIAHDGTNHLACMKGGDYVYFDVPVAVFDAMCSSESAGKFHNAEIKGKYEYRQMTDHERTAVDHAEPLPEPASTLLSEAGHNLIVPHFNNWGGAVDIKFLDANVTVKYAKDGDAAFDLMASIVADPVTDEVKPYPVMVLPGQHVLVKTGIAMKLPRGLAGLVVPRSGLAKKARVSVVNTPGLIDSGYTGEIGVLFENRGDTPILINRYDRIAQFLITPAITPTFRIVADLEQTERGSSGFGSSGVTNSPEVVV